MKKIFALILILSALSINIIGQEQTKQPKIQIPLLYCDFMNNEDVDFQWQNFSAAYRTELSKEKAFMGDMSLKTYIDYSINESGKLIWRFENIALKKFKVRIFLPRQENMGNVYFHMLMNDTKGDAYFFKHYYVDGKKKSVKQSPLPYDKWITYEASYPNDIVKTQIRKPNPNSPVADFALMNVSREELGLKDADRPIFEAIFLCFDIEKKSKLDGKKIVVYIDTTEIY